MSDGYVAQDVGDVFTLVGRHLQVLVDVLELDDGDRILRLEDVHDGMAEDVVRDVLQAVHLDASLFDQARVLDRPYAGDGLLDLDDAELDQLCQLDHRVVGLGDAVTVHLLCGAVDVVEDVVQRWSEAGDLFGLKRRDERPVQLLVDLVCDVVSPVLELFHLTALLFHVLEIFDEVDEEIGCGDDCPGHLVKKVEECLVLGDYPLLNAHDDRYKFLPSGAIYRSVMLPGKGGGRRQNGERISARSPGERINRLSGAARPAVCRRDTVQGDSRPVPHSETFTRLLRMNSMSASFAAISKSIVP